MKRIIQILAITCLYSCTTEDLETQIDKGLNSEFVINGSEFETDYVSKVYLPDSTIYFRINEDRPRVGLLIDTVYEGVIAEEYYTLCLEVVYPDSSNVSFCDNNNPINTKYLEIAYINDSTFKIDYMAVFNIDSIGVYPDSVFTLSGVSTNLEE